MKLLKIKSEVKLIFNDLKSFDEFDSHQMNDLSESAECTSSVEITVTVSVGKVETTVKTEDITCKEMSKTIKKIKQAAREAIR